MFERSGLASLALCGVLALGIAAARADEEKIPLDKVPAAVMKAVKDKFPKATVKEAEKETEDGKTTYEIGLEENGKGIDVSLKEDGTILEIEKEIDAKDLPKPVADAVKGKYPGGAIKKAEEVSKDGKTLYEVVVTVGDKARELLLDPAGKILEDEDD